MFSRTQPKVQFTSDPDRNRRDTLANFSECNLTCEELGRRTNEQENKQGVQENRDDRLKDKAVFLVQVATRYSLLLP